MLRVRPVAFAVDGTRPGLAIGRALSHPRPFMAQQPVELILVRHLASRLGVPVFVVDPAGDLVYFNEPAERVLGRRFDEIRVMPFEEWTTVFAPSASGRRLAPEELPLVVALRWGRPDHRSLDIIGGDGVRRTIEVTAFPILGPAERRIGAVAMFWERDER
jgi:PAS domain-containing protein